MGIQINGNNDTISALDGSWTAQGATTFTGAADFNGKVSVGGTLTYEDVTNIDSVGIVTARDGVFIPDTKKLEVGNAAGSGDLKIHHTSGNSFIENGTGTLKIRGATIELSNPSAAQMLQANSTAAINLYFNGSKKFETTSSGIDVTGVVVADDLIVTGTSVVGDFKSTNNNYVLGIAGNNSSVKAYFGTDSSGNFLLATGSGVAERLRITTAGNVDINGSPPWSVAGGDYRNLSISGQIANAGGFLWLGNGTATTNGDFDLGRINFCNGATITSQIAGSTQTSANDDGRITFLTKATGGSIAERLRITSTGVVLINQTTVGAKSAPAPLQLISSASGAFGLNISMRSNNDYGFISYTDNDASEDLVQLGVQRTAADKGDLIIYTNAGNTSATERLRIRSTGIIASNLSTGAVLELTRTTSSVTALCGKIVFGNTNWDSSMASIQSYQDGANDNANLRFYTQAAVGAGEIERLRITSAGTLHQGEDGTFSRQVGKTSHGNGASKTYSISAFYYGFVTFKMAMSDGNYKHAHIHVELGGMQYSSGNGYVATVVANGTGNGPSISLNKQDGAYHITVANGGNSNTLYGSYVLEASSYNNHAKPTLTIS